MFFLAISEISTLFYFESLCFLEILTPQASLEIYRRSKGLKHGPRLERQLINDKLYDEMYVVYLCLYVTSSEPPSCTNNHRRSTTNHRRSTTNHRRSTTNHRRSTTNHGRSTTNHRRSTTNHGRSITNHRRSTTNHRRTKDVPCSDKKKKSVSSP